MSPAPPALFASVLGNTFASLPEPVRRLHEGGTASYAGTVAVERGDGVLSRLCAWATRLPPAFRGRIDVRIECHDGGERWSRHVAGRVMRSRLWARDGRLHEALGLVTFVFRLSADASALRWQVEAVRVLGLLPLPVRWFAGVVASESAEDGDYRFDVRATLPWVGLLVHYRGLLRPA